MDPHAAVRLRARQAHAEALAHNGGDRSSRAITAAAADLRDATIVPFAPGTRFADSVLGCFERVGMLISVASTLAPSERALVIAHEIGHCDLHDDPVSEVVELHLAASPLPGGIMRVDGYSSRERKEVEADAFASEFLCPADWLRGQLLAGRRPSGIALTLGLPRLTVTRQAIRALMLPPLAAPVAQARHDHPLDVTQAAAATWSGGPLLVEAGPGTGKTATLVGRVRHLLGTGVPPSAILVLTFSNRAAAELRARIATGAPEAAASMWVGTFHSFGLEVIHRWHDRVGRGPAPRVLDRDGSLDALERHMERLPNLDRVLRDPVGTLSPMLRAIERCKDEMIGPAEYAAAARAAALDGDGEAVQAALALAATYRAYQEILAEEDAVDLGDLVMMAATLLEGDDQVARHYGDRFAHVLVDEVQDVNAASIRLLGSLCGPGTGLWAVGDARQSIYRFRGAHGHGANRFAADFGGQSLALGVNYRSGQPVIAAFSAFSAAMRGGTAEWHGERGPVGSVRIAGAPTITAEGAAIAERIEDLRGLGIGYGDQAVLARTHLTLDRIGAALEARGVPLLYLGDLVARPEVRDLLAFLAVEAEPGGIALLRLAALPDYAVPRGDALAAIRWAARNGMPLRAVLAKAPAIPGVTAAGAAGLSRLGRELATGAPDATAWSILTAWLIEAGGYLRPLLAAGDSRATMRLAAIYQLLELAANEGGGPRRLIDRVRRIAALGEGRAYGVLAPEAESPEAVRLMTAHGAKGLEFEAVHLAGAASSYMPLARRRQPCPPPPGLERLALGPEDHDAEEKALFFVALSRARTHLTISHARRYTAGRESARSPFLGRIGPAEMVQHGDVAAVTADLPPVPQPPRSAYPEGELRTYLRCPARYRYEVVDGLGAVVPPAAHRRLRRCIRRAVAELERTAQNAGAAPGEDEASAMLRGAWAADGPVGHPHEAALMGAADAMVGRVAAAMSGEIGAGYHHGEWTVGIGAGWVAVRPDRVIEHPWGAVTVQVLRALRRPGAGCEPIHALLLAGGRERFPDHRVAIEAVDPATGEAHRPDTTMEDEALEPYRQAIAGIEGGSFAPRPDARQCPACPFFVACGA